LGKSRYQKPGNKGSMRMDFTGCGSVYWQMKPAKPKLNDSRATKAGWKTNVAVQPAKPVRTR
jgi:hypothetical protein